VHAAGAGRHDAGVAPGWAVLAVPFHCWDASFEIKGPKKRNVLLAHVVVETHEAQAPSACPMLGIGLRAHSSVPSVYIPKMA
jgi:hypothetical protein